MLQGITSFCPPLGVENLPCVEQIDRSSAGRMKDPKVMCEHCFSNTEFPVVKKIRWHEFSRICPELSMVCVLGNVSQMQT